MTLTREELRKHLTYEPSTGQFIRVSARGGRAAGSVAGCPKSGGYIAIRVNGRKYEAHRLAWLDVHGCFPVGLIDHRNGDPADNRIDNLRETTPALNAANSRIRKDNSSGFKGVSREFGRWRATIRIDKRNRFLGYFDTPEAAHAAYCAAADKHHGEFARHA